MMFEQMVIKLVRWVFFLVLFLCAIGVLVFIGMVGLILLEIIFKGQ